MTNIERVRLELEAHLRALRRKLKRATIRGEPVERLQTRILHEQELLGKMASLGGMK